MNEQKLKKWIDDATYEQLLEKWRFAPTGDPFFNGEIGKYFCHVMYEKKERLSTQDRTDASKTIGWD